MQEVVAFSQGGSLQTVVAGATPSCRSRGGGPAPVAPSPADPLVMNRTTALLAVLVVHPRAPARFSWDRPRAVEAEGALHLVFELGAHLSRPLVGHHAQLPERAGEHERPVLPGPGRGEAEGDAGLAVLRHQIEVAQGRAPAEDAE